MSTKPALLRRGACPGVVDAMEAADGMLIRLLLPGGAVTGAQLGVIADIASVHGNGIVEITARANLQIRGVDAGRVDVAADELIRAGLADGDPSINARRAVVAAALAGHDPLAAVDATPFVVAIAEELRAVELPGTLPAKFSVVVDDHSPRGVADLTGHVVVPIRPGDSPARVAELVATAVVAMASDRHPDPVVPVRPPTPQAFTGPEVGIHDHVEPARCNVIAAPAFGRLDPTMLRALGDLCRHGPVRFTHWRGVAIAGVDRSVLDAVIGQLVAADLSADPADPVHSVTACAGSPGCASSRAYTQAAAATLVADRRRRGAAGPLRRVHLSGCEKLCGAPANALAVIAGLDGRLEAGR